MCINYVQLSFPLPKMIPEEVFPNCAQKHQLLFNRNVLWCFEDFQMLIGTDLPVFENGNKSSLSPRLRFNIYLLTHYNLILLSKRI